MASILKVTATLDFSSDILNKEAGELVKDAITQAIPVVIGAMKKEFKTDPKSTKKDTVKK